MTCNNPMCVECLLALLDAIVPSGKSRVNPNIPRVEVVAILRASLLSMAKGEKSLPDGPRARLIRKNIIRESGLISALNESAI